MRLPRFAAAGLAALMQLGVGTARSLFGCLLIEARRM
jgi:hypothetical protein